MADIKIHNPEPSHTPTQQYMPDTTTSTIDTSIRLFEQAVALLPGGVNSPARAFKAVGGQPLFIERGEGAFLIDVDGNRYVDYVLSFGPLILGHAPAVLLRPWPRRQARARASERRARSNWIWRVS